jgi:hypothetical protein
LGRLGQVTHTAHDQPRIVAIVARMDGFMPVVRENNAPACREGRHHGVGVERRVRAHDQRAGVSGLARGGDRLGDEACRAAHVCGPALA